MDDFNDVPWMTRARTWLSLSMLAESFGVDPKDDPPGRQIWHGHEPKLVPPEKCGIILWIFIDIYSYFWIFNGIFIDVISFIYIYIDWVLTRGMMGVRLVRLRSFTVLGACFCSMGATHSSRTACSGEASGRG